MVNRLIFIKSLFNIFFDKNLKSLFIGCITSFVFIQCNGQTENSDTTNYSTTIKEQAEQMAKALLQKDFDTYKKFTSPKMDAIFGGEEKMIESLKNGLSQLESQGMQFLNVTFGEPTNVIVVDKELQGTIPQKSEIKTSAGRLITTSTLIVISDDKGKHWYFVDSFGKDIEYMRTNFPTLNLSDKLAIPKKPEPTIIND
jgi:hypothetical protein